MVASPGDVGTLRAIAYRESRGRWLGRHKVDHRPRGWKGNGSRAARRVGSRDWSTRGSWGHVAAYAMPYLPCLPPRVLDLPIVSAWVAAKRLRRARRPGAPPALRRWATVR